jgi:hypothetical protein
MKNPNGPKFSKQTGEMLIDEGIKPAVDILNEHGFVTIESCQGGEGHAYFDPMVRFEGTEFDLIRAWEVCAAFKLCVFEAHRVYRKCTVIYNESEEIGETWEEPINEILFVKHLKTGTIFKPQL